MFENIPDFPRKSVGYKSNRQKQSVYPKQFLSELLVCYCVELSEYLLRCLKRHKWRHKVPMLKPSPSRLKLLS
nr:unnamed protein product [Callosobruchus chinensis]